MARDHDGNLHTLIKPILYEINSAKDQTHNIIGFEMATLR
jgi:hypothetical protein